MGWGIRDCEGKVREVGKNLECGVREFKGKESWFL